MARYNLGSLPVRRFDGSLSGMVTDRDLVVRCMAADKAPGSVRVGSVMTKRLVSVPENMDVNLAARLMAREQVRTPARDRAGRACRAFDACGFVAG